MHAIVVRAFGGPEVLQLEEVPRPAPGPHEVLVRIEAVGVNPYDTYMRSGGYAISPDLPYTPGADAAGTVERVGERVTRLDVGDRVYIGGTSKSRAYGAYASHVVCTRRQVHPLPARLSFAQGAALNVPYGTAWRALQRAEVDEGETVFIHGASGAVGLAATQLARAAGLTVIGTAGTGEGMALVRSQGAAHVLNHREAGYLDQLSSITSGGPDVILEMRADVNLDHDLAAVGRRGRIVIIGSRGRIEIDPRRAMMKDATVLGMSFWGISEDDLVRMHEALVKGCNDGSITPVIGRELPLAEAARAHELVLTPGASGKIVLIP